MLSRTVIRSLRATVPMRRVTPTKYASLNAGKRFNSSSSDQEKRRDELLSALTSNNKLRQVFEEFRKLCESKGFNASMGVMQQMKFLMDTEVRAHLKKVGEEMQAAGIEIKPEDLKSFSEIFTGKK